VQLSAVAKASLLLESLGEKDFEQGLIRYIAFVGQDFGSSIMATGRRTEIVRSVGLRFGSLACFAFDQSTNAVESTPDPCADQNSNSSLSFLNLGIAFYMPLVLLDFSLAHVAPKSPEPVFYHRYTFQCAQITDRET
jgi:hypothetical protein